MTFVTDDGIPHDQLDAVFQSVLVVPVHVSKIQLTFKIPALAVKFGKLVLVAPEPVPPYVALGSETTPTVNAFAFIVNAFRFAIVELPNEIVPFIVPAAENVTPAELLMFRLFTIVGKPVPVICAELPL